MLLSDRVLFPGGMANLITSQYARTGRILYQLTLQVWFGFLLHLNKNKKKLKLCSQ